MWIDIPFAILIERNVDVFTAIFLVYSEATFELHLNEIIAIYVTGDEICTLPIVVELHAIKAVISQLCGHLLEIEIFLLA